MAKATSKRTKTFKRKHLRKVIDDRRKWQGVQKKRDARKIVKAKRAAVGGNRKHNGDAAEDGDEQSDGSGGVNDFLDLSAEEDDNDEEMEVDGDNSDEDSGDDDGEDVDDDLEDLQADEEKHKVSMASLKKHDPEFYEYLQKNDRGLLEFGEDDEPDQVERDDDEDDDEESEEEEPKPKKKGKDIPEKMGEEQEVLTMEMLKSWQKAMIEKRSLAHLRQLLLAFKSAVFAEESDEDTLKYSIQSSKVFNKVVVTTLKYTPVVFTHHIPIKELANGKIKVSSEKKNYGAMQRLLKSYINSLCQLLKTSTGPDTISTAASESSKLAGYIIGNRLVAKNYIKTLLDLLSTTTEDSVRISTVVALQKLSRACDPGLLELLLKNSYVALLRSSKRTTIHTMSGIEFMKNAYSDFYLLNEKLSYEIAFGYIRQLAVHLRNTLKSKTKESFAALHNWQFIHSIDFWSLVLSRTCQKNAESTKESLLQPLIYPLVQVTLGSIRVLPISKAMPFRFHCIKSLNRLSERTGVYIPLSAYLLEVLESAELKESGGRKRKRVTLKPLDLELQIRAPDRYLRTEVYAQSVLDELIYLILEHLNCRALSIAFPELVTPVLIRLRKYFKSLKARPGSGGGGKGDRKSAESIKTLIDKIEANRKMINDKRRTVDFGPDSRDEILAFCQDENAAQTPLGTFLRLQRKTREAKREMLERAAFEEDDDAAKDEDEEEDDGDSEDDEEDDDDDDDEEEIEEEE